ncbi:MAG: hydrogen peroxide-inducible genes activator [Flavobacteriaceae bacterium]|jgi:LysR family hydrogen peroxide-inducible transcriptional activator|uniref:hydrogen peroxide-inducible genes activator n=1 Tax=Candidatus Arcticimaribacter forsetii TaxID=2820661 RepID=UPI0020774503|nr:hydrogen peroxide-inducible genes activator [Candidatus Arcticimaribacter forsetii]MCH1539280.1 hydrogen peroxide-inducible genes activator [Flavobacteriaceae bacterium]MDB2345627.1 hydrogen peroxide-inducible genes activator [Flavobacteriaceae bacterium]MDB4643559.1 hydrogen peroxide-inducible genes activator [Flavobacteriaceae bacterium]MDB4674824.1 hydrogen peroxide-inducible genes activator [Flavobacteriaceae bacterium]MDC0960187.1 hydrogen peroxide-inducible genes activator [Flavobacte
MTLTQLKYMIAVAEAGNFTLAAEKSFVTQPTLSMQIQKLEEELGVQIFNRAKKPIRLTKVGSEILIQARKIISESKRMEDVVAQEKGFIGGDFTLGIIPTVMPTLLPMFLNTFLKSYPKVNLKIEELTTENIIKKLEEGKIDAGICATPLKQEKIIERPLYYEPFVAYVPGNHRLAKSSQINVEDLENEDILLLQDGHCFKNQVLSMCSLAKSGMNGRLNLKSGSFETLVNLANEGLGMTLVPYLNANNLSEKNAQNIIHFPAPPPAREISIIYHKSQLKLQIIEALKESISSVVRGAIAFDDVKIVSP